MRPVPEQGNPAAVTFAPLTRGTRVGRFLVLGLVGKGGMGEVYAAHDPELDRKVAIKLLRAASDGSGQTGGDARTRLIREAQAIAKVSHPNVVVVYEVGTFEGRVFIAMEFVEGHTLGYWLLAGNRTTAQILEAFGAAGRGLAAAHEKDLVHRDFKPDNAMVATNGHVRVMDFGLARIAIGRVSGSNPQARTPPAPLAIVKGGGEDDFVSTRILRDETPPPASTATLNTERHVWNLTMEGTILGTPAYMSPEQFRGEMADARSDQFSFCVALYEALYGERPFSARSMAELTAQVIGGQFRPEPAGARAPASIRRALLRGLSPDPEARFPTMNALLQALGQEQTASGTRRFAAGAAARLAGVWEAPEGESASETDAQAEIRRAFLATGKPYAVATFDLVRKILDRFTRRWTDLYVEACEATHVLGEQSAETLDLRMEALGEALEDLRALCRQFQRSTPDMIENAANAANALGTLERCSDVNLLRAIVRPPENPQTRLVVEQLRVRLSEIRALARLGRVAEGLKLVVVLQDEARRIGYAPLLSEVLFVAGMMYFEVSDIDMATRALEDAVWTAELCRHDEVAAEAAANLVFVAGDRQSRFDVAELWSRHAETVLDRMGGHELIRGWLFNNRGAMRAAQGRLRDAIRENHLAIVAKEKVLGPQDPDVALSIGNIAVFLDELGETREAAEYAERAVKIVQSALGLDHPKAATMLANHAEILNRMGRHLEAHEPAELALAVFERETDPRGLYVTYPLMALGTSLAGQGRCEEAVPHLERAVSIREGKEGLRMKLAESHFALGRALWGTGKEYPRAFDLVERARVEYLAATQTPATVRELAEIERWRESRPRPPGALAAVV